MALKFYASVRLDVRRIQSIKLGSEIIGNRTRVRVVKNKVAPPFRTAEFDIMYNEGISKVGDVLDLATELDIVNKRGSFYSYGELRLGQGRENAKEYLGQNPALAEEIETAVRQQALTGVLPLPYVDSGEEEPSAEEEI
jgi:recombination protein RecA